MSMTREEIEELMNGKSPKILYDLYVVPYMFTTKPEVVLNRNYVLAKKENILVEHEINMADIMRCMKDQRPDLIIAIDNISVGGNRLRYGNIDG